MTNPFEARLAAPMTAKRAILSALSATGGPLTTAQITQCGVLLGVDAAAVRVALGRLVKKRDVITIARGVHTLGDKGRPIFEALQRWTTLPQHTRAWDGRWVLVHTAHLGRAHRATLRRRERALSFFGFASLFNGLWLRPDNLSLDGSTLHQRLVGLGLEQEALLGVNTTLVSMEESEIAKLWDQPGLEAGYREAKLAIQQCLDAQAEASLQGLAKDTALLGAAVIGMLSFDPLLPEELIDAGLRQEVHQGMLKLDRVGKEALTAFWEHTNTPQGKADEA